MQNRTVKGLLIFGAGLIVFLNTMGILTHWLNALIVIGAVLLMVYGFMEMDGSYYVNRALEKVKKLK